MASTPCDNCPWRRDAPRGHWADDHFTAIFHNCQHDGTHMMLCHKANALPAEQQGSMPCRGWLLAIGFEAIGVRLLCAQGRITRADLERSQNCPELFGTFADMLRANGVRVPRPNNHAQRRRRKS